MKLLITVILLIITLNADGILNGKYSFRSTVTETQSHERYPFKMNLSVSDNSISGDIDYFNDNCSGVLEAKLLSSTQLQISETITKGADICANGTYIYDLKYQIINSAKSYTLEKSTHNVAINRYKFIPDPYTWKNKALIQKIDAVKSDIQELKDTIVKKRELIKESQNSAKDSKEYLAQNPEVFKRGDCIIPPQTEAPEPLFDTKQKAHNYALAYCSISFGCKVGVQLAKDKLNTTSKRFLASQACTLMVKNYQLNNTLIQESMFNLLDAVSYSECNSEGNDIFSTLLQGGSCVMSGAIKIARVQQYLRCIDYKTEMFYNSYLNWINEPKKRKDECENHLDIIADAPKTVSKFYEEVESIKEKIQSKSRQLQQLKNKLEAVKLLRYKQLKLLEQLQH